MYVVVMFEPALKGERLTLSGQTNEVFGPFDNEEEAMKWTEQAIELIRKREWLVIPLSSPTTLNAINPTIN